METMLILPGVANIPGHSDPKGLLDRPSALEYARRRFYTGRVLDISGETGPTSPQTLTALREFRRDESITALYGFSGGGYNLRWVISALDQFEKNRIRLLVVLGAPRNSQDLYNGPWELVYRKDPPQGHMAGPSVLLSTTPLLVTKDTS